MRPTLPPILLHPCLAPCLLLALALSGCWANHAHSEAGAADGPPAEPDTSLASARRNGAVGGSEGVDGSAEGNPDLAIEAGGPDRGAEAALAPDAAADL